jgi:hypothetical protein
VAQTLNPNALTSLQNVKDWCLGTNQQATTYDDILTRLINVASTFFEKMTGRTILASVLGTINETQIAEWHAMYFIPRESPVISVTQILMNGSPMDQHILPTDDGWYQDGDVIRLKWVHVIPYSQIDITYTAGWATVPNDIEQAVIELVQLKYKDRTKAGANTQSMMGESISYLPALIPLTVQRVIDAYKRRD